MQLTKADVTAALAMLRHEGYTVQVSPVGAGRRVVLRYGQEHWQTDGASTAEALSTLLGRMLPSAMTKALFASALRASASAPAGAARATNRPAGPDVQVRRRPSSVV
jgi:hypothetical protein